MKLGFIDITVLIVYFLSQIAIGLYVGRKNKSTDQYFLAGKSFSGLIIGISFIGSIISSSTFLAFPADSFKTAWLRFVPHLAFPVVTLLAAWLLVPFFRRGTITSAYQYLALRYGPSISVYASLVFIIMQLLRTSMIAYLLSILVDEMTGWGFTTSLLIIVGVTALYTVKGGLKAVIWTDVIQTFVLFLGGIVCVVFILTHVPGGLGGFFSDAIAHNKFSMHDMDASGQLVPTKFVAGLGEKSITMLFLLGCVSFLNLQFDQSTIQRWCSARTAADARRSMYVLSVGCIPVWGLFQFLGTCLFVYYLHNPTEVSGGILSGLLKAERILPHFIMTQLSGGLAGLVIAGAFAAGMSTLSACINVASMVSVNDIYAKYINRDSTDKRHLFLGKTTSLCVSALMIAGAFIIYKMPMLTLTDFMLTAGVIFTVGIPSVFLAGMFTRRVGVAAVWPSVIAGMSFTAWVLLGNGGYLPAALTFNMPSYYVSVLGNGIALVLALLLSLILKPKARDLTNLTIWDQSSKELE